MYIANLTSKNPSFNHINPSRWLPTKITALHQLKYRSYGFSLVNLCREAAVIIVSISLPFLLPLLLLAPYTSNESNVRPPANIMNKQLTFLYKIIFRNDLKRNFYRRTRKI